MDIQPGTATSDQATSVRPGTSEAIDEIVESTAKCPSCNYTGDSEFQTCPSCGIIIRKHFLKLSKANAAAFATSSEVDADAAGELPKSSRKALFGVLCSLLITILGVMFYQARTHSTLSGPPNNRTSSPSVPAPGNPATNAPLTTLQGEKVPAGPTENEHTLPNSLGISIKSTVFASDVDASNMPVNNLSSIPFNGKKIVVRLKMDIPPERTYRFTGKFYDGDGKLVMNVASPSHPSLSTWSAWYYHDLNRVDDKPGNWRFVFLVDGEQVLEKVIEVVDQ